MSQTSNRFSVMLESNDILKSKHEMHSKDNHSGSVGDLPRTGDFRLPTAHLSREDSISSGKSSITSLFKKSFEGSWSTGSIIGFYTPRPEKTLALFDTILAALNDLYDKYHKLTCSDIPVETQDYNEICTKLTDRMNMIQDLMTDYRILIDDKQVEFDKINANLKSLLSNKHSKESIDLADNEAYWSTCKELFVIESKLERCSGKLQFQIMELDFIGKISPLDQYELSIRLNDSTKFKTRIKIEKNGHQVWDIRTFAINPVIDDFLYIKFSEIKQLNKSTVLLEKKLPFINNLIRSDPSIFTLWLSPVGTIKLKVIVQWNSVLDDPGLQTYLTGIDCKFSDQSAKNDLSVRSRSASSSHKYAANRLSVNLDSLFRSDRINNDSRSNSMGNIAEDIEDDKVQKDVSRKISKEMCLSENQLSLLVAQHEQKEEEEQVVSLSPQHAERLPTVQVNIIGEDEAMKEKNIEIPKIVLLTQESVPIDLEDSSLNQNIGDKVELYREGDVVRGEIDSRSAVCEVKTDNDHTEKESEGNTEDDICMSEIEKVEFNKEDLDISIKDETPEHVSLVEGVPPSHIFGCEDNGQVIESPIVTFVSSSSNPVDDVTENATKQSDSDIPGDEMGDCKLPDSSAEHCSIDTPMPALSGPVESGEVPQLLCLSEDLHNFIPTTAESKPHDSSVIDSPPVHSTTSDCTVIACPQFGSEEVLSDDTAEDK